MTIILRSFATLMLAAVASIAAADGGCPAPGVGEGVFQQESDEQPGKLKQLVEEPEEDEEDEEDEEPDCE